MTISVSAVAWAFVSDDGSNARHRISAAGKRTIVDSNIPDSDRTPGTRAQNRAFETNRKGAAAKPSHSARNAARSLNQGCEPGAGARTRLRRKREELRGEVRWLERAVNEGCEPGAGARTRLRRKREELRGEVRWLGRAVWESHRLVRTFYSSGRGGKSSSFGP
jgi:hypothetical protein